MKRKDLKRIANVWLVVGLCAAVVQCIIKQKCFFFEKDCRGFNECNISIEMRNKGEWNVVLAPDSFDSACEINKLIEM